MQLLLRNDGLYIAINDDNRGMKTISLEDLIFKFIELLKEIPNSQAIHDLSEVNNWLYNYQIDLGDAIEQRKQESLLDKLKELALDYRANAVFTSWDCYEKDPKRWADNLSCLLYTSDAADE